MNRLLGVIVALTAIAAAVAATTLVFASTSNAPRHWATCLPGYRLSHAEGICVPRTWVKP